MEKLEDVLDSYDICRKRVFRGRKMVMCEAQDGVLYGITESALSEGRLAREYLAKQYLIQNGYTQIDQLCRNRNDEFLTEDRYHTTFIVKRFYNGRELAVDSLSEVKEGACNLACMHAASAGMLPWLRAQEEPFAPETGTAVFSAESCANAPRTDPCNAAPDAESCSPQQWLGELFAKRNRELRRISAYMRKPGRKGDFVQAYNACAGTFVQEGLHAVDCLREMEPYLQKLEARLTVGFCHGAYQHHNILRQDNGWATVGMEQFHFGVQLEDLYDFLRKVLEKNNYSFSYAQAVLKGYEERLPLGRTEQLCLYLRLLYPEKFWKIANRYYNSKKTWVPPKMVEKLNNVVKQNEEKSKFLVKFKEDFVDCEQ